MAIVGNKAHKYNEEQVTEEEGRKFAEENDAIFMLVSSKTGGNIDLLFEDIGEAFLKKKKEKIKKETIKKDFNYKLNKLDKFIDF